MTQIVKPDENTSPFLATLPGQLQISDLAPPHISLTHQLDCIDQVVVTALVSGTEKNLKKHHPQCV